MRERNVSTTNGPNWRFLYQISIDIINFIKNLIQLIFFDFCSYWIELLIKHIEEI